MTTGDRGHLLRWLERILVTAGVAGLVWAGYVWLAPGLYRLEHRDVRVRPRRDIRLETAPPARVEAPLTTGTVIGTLEIRRLGFSGMVAEGDDDATLRVAIGHLPDTPLPWNAGNSALAGHRDGEFRPLRGLQIGDEVQLTTDRGTFRYRIRATKIVAPEDLSVLAPTSGRTLTLITCYPFVYIGHAPQRFIVIADAVS
jgi:sortase A